jgi:two-component system response regulator RpfG
VDVRHREHETLMRLAKAGEYRDEETGNHIIRMARYSRLIANGLGLGAEECELIEYAAPMHDIGKIGITDTILLKQGRLTSDETKVMRKHTIFGYEILRDSPSKYLQIGALIALGHHERYDGKGYPHGLARDFIPLPARIVAVADVFDALTSVRPYKEAWPIKDALNYLNAEIGRHFDPDCINAFHSQFEKILSVRQKFLDLPAVKNG